MGSRPAPYKADYQTADARAVATPGVKDQGKFKSKDPKEQEDELIDVIQFQSYDNGIEIAESSTATERRS